MFLTEEGTVLLRAAAAVNHDEIHLKKQIAELRGGVKTLSFGVTLDVYKRQDWSRRQKDGYYYYHRALAAGETTEPLFTTLSAKKDLKDFRIIVYSESVQAQGSGSPQEAFAPYEEGR